jgi:hypothetical protein
VGWQKNSSFGFYRLGFCVGKNQMCYLCGGLSSYFVGCFSFFSMNGNVLAMRSVPVLRLRQAYCV